MLYVIQCANYEKKYIGDFSKMVGVQSLTLRSLT